MIKVLELFAGIGSQAKALTNLSIEFESDICEFDDRAVQSYSAINGGAYNYGDITTATINKQYDLWTYSFPCQDLSEAGKRDSGLRGERSGLLYEVGRLLSECKEVDKLPGVLLMENVQTLLWKSNIDGFNEWCEYLESLGYNNSYKILDSIDFGIPQQRKRIFMVSYLEGSFDFDNLETSELRDIEEFVDFDFEHKQPTSKQHLFNYNSVKDLPYDKLIYFHDTSLNFSKGRTATHRIDRSITVTTGNRLSKMKQGKTNFLTPKECFLLMGFTEEDYLKCAELHSASTLRKQAGNSIVVQVLEAIFKEMQRNGKV
jgi:DNA (cytosine-5)-methyltransferase 1